MTSRRKPPERKISYGGCSSGKVTYSNRKVARVRAGMARKYGRKLRPYQCPECKGIHLTSQEKHKKSTIDWKAMNK